MSLLTKSELILCFFVSNILFLYFYFSFKFITGKSIFWWFNNGPLESDE